MEGVFIMAKRKKHKTSKFSNQMLTRVNNSLYQSEPSRTMHSLQQNIWYSLPQKLSANLITQSNAMKLAKELAVLTQLEFLGEAQSILVASYDFNNFNSVNPELSNMIKLLNHKEWRYNIQGKHCIYHISANMTNDCQYVNIIQIHNNYDYARMGKLKMSKNDNILTLIDNIDIVFDCGNNSNSFNYMASNSTEYTKLFFELVSIIADPSIPVAGVTMSIHGEENGNKLFSTIFNLCPHGYVNDNIIMYLQDNKFSPTFTDKYANGINIDLNSLINLIQVVDAIDIKDCIDMNVVTEILDHIHNFDDNELFSEIPLLDFSDREIDIIHRYANHNNVYCDLYNPKDNLYYDLKSYLTEQRFGINFRKDIDDPNMKGRIIHTVIFTCPNYDTKQIDFFVLHNSNKGQYGLYIMHYENMEHFNPIHVDAVYYYIIIDKEHGGYITFKRNLLETTDIPLIAIHLVTETMVIIHDHPETTAMITEKHERLFNKPKPDNLTNPDFVIRRIIKTHSMAQKYIKEKSSIESNKSVKYTLEEWGRRAHIRKLKDGREIYIKASQCHRHKPLSDIEIHLKL